MTRTAYQKARLEAMPNCTWVEGCSRKVVNVASQLCANHYDQTPKGRDLKLRQQYGLALGEFDNLMKMQGGKCGICNTSESIGKHGKITRLCVDHDHKTGAVRGLLCARCNAALGKFQDDPKLLAKAILWLGLENIPDSQLVFRSLDD